MSRSKSYKFLNSDGILYIPREYRDAVGAIGTTVFELSVSGDTIMLKKTDRRTVEEEMTEVEMEAERKEIADKYSVAQTINHQKRKKMIKCSMCGCIHDLVKYKEKIYCNSCIRRVIKQ